MSLKAKWLKKAGEAYTSYKDKRPVSTDGASKGCNYSGPRGSCPRPTITGSTFCDLHTCPTAGCPEPKSSQSPKCGTGCVLVQPPPVGIFVCALCADLDLGSQEALQEHYLVKHSGDDAAPGSPRRPSPSMSNVQSDAPLVSLLDNPVPPSAADPVAPPAAAAAAPAVDAAALQKELKEEKWFSTSLKEEINALKTENAMLASGQEAATGASSEMITDLLAKLEAANQDRAAAAAQEATATAALQPQALKIAELEAKVTSAESLQSSAVLKLTQADAALSVAQAELAPLKARTADLDQQLSGRQAEIAKLSVELSARPYPEEVAALNQEIAALTQSSGAPVASSSGTEGSGAAVDAAALARTAGELAVLKRRTEELQAALATKTDAHRGVAASLEAASTGRDTLQLQVATLTTTLAEVQHHLAEKTRGHSTLAALLTQEKSAKELLQKEMVKLVDLQVHLSDAKSAILTKTSTIEALERKLVVNDRAATEAAARDAELAVRADELAAQLRAAQTEIETQKRATAIKLAAAEEATEKVANLEMAIERSQKKAGSKNQDILELRDKIVEYKDLLESSKAEKVELRNKLREEGKLSNEVAERVREQQRVTGALQQAVEDARDQLCAQLKGHEARVADVSAAKDTEADLLKDRISTLEGDLDAIGQDIAQMAQSTGASSAQTEQLSADLEAAQAAARKAAEELTQTKETLEARCEELDTTNTELAQKETVVSRKVAGLERELSSASATVAELEEDKEQLETDMGQMAKKYRQSQKDAKALNMMIEQTKKLFITQKLELQRENTAIKEVLVQTQTDLRAGELEKDSLKDRSGRELISLRQNCERAEKENDAMRRKLDETRDELGGELKILQSNLTSTQQRLDDASQRITGMRSEMDGLVTEKRAIEQTMREVNLAREGVVDQCMKLKKELATLQKTFNSLNQDLKYRTAALQEMGQENQELQRTINEMTSRQWQGGKGVKECSDCSAKFTAVNRKHHCRNCGMIFCGSCSSKTAKTSASKSKVRVCNACYQDLT